MKELINKYGLIVLSVIAIIALFFPMATVTVESDLDEFINSISGFEAAFQGYVGILLFVGPIGIIAAHFLPQLQLLKKKLMIISPIVGIIVTVIAYFQAVNIASAADGFEDFGVDVYASIGFGGILCLIAHAATGVLVYIQNKEEIHALFKK